MSAGASSIEAMTFNYLTVGTKITGGEGSFSKLGVSGKTTLQALTVNGVTGFSESVTFSRVAYFDDDIVINVAGTQMYLDTAKCVELGILS